jgi:putative hydrolase of the HAD superfamily
MKYRCLMPGSDCVQAVVFDFYGTLTVHATAATRRKGADRVAEALGVAPDSFFDRLSATFTERATGRRGDLAQTLAWVAQGCGHEPSEEQLSAACAERRAVETSFAEMLRPDAFATLSSLRERGLRLGVISDCTHELPEYWSRLSVAELVQAVVFSVLVGERKPHHSLYKLACDALDVAPVDVVYVGDGGSNELSGAQAVGMTAVKLLADDAMDALVYDPEPAWAGHVIHNLSDLVTTTSALLRPGRKDHGGPGR